MAYAVRVYDREGFDYVEQNKSSLLSQRALHLWEAKECQFQISNNSVNERHFELYSFRSLESILHSIKRWC